MTTLPGSLKYRIAAALAFLALTAFLTSQPAPREQVGPLPDGAFLLNSGWRLDPAGRQVPLDTLPMFTALSPDGKYLLVLNGGFKPPSVSVIETAPGPVTPARPAGFHRRRRPYPRRPPDLRRQPLSRYRPGGQPAVRHADRPGQDRP